jgi:hypothetical protein
MFKNLLACLFIGVIFSCTSNKSRYNPSTDSTSYTKNKVISGSDSLYDELEEETDFFYMRVDPWGSISEEHQKKIYKILTEKDSLPGKLIGVVWVTDNFLVSDNLNDDRDLFAVIVQTAEREFEDYTTEKGIHYEKIYSWLAVFEQTNDGTKLVDSTPLRESNNQPRIANNVIGSHGGFELADNRFAAEIHYLSWERGAGDYSFNLDEVAIFAFLNNKISNIFEAYLEDNRYSSSEMADERSSQSSMKKRMNVLKTNTNGLYDIQLEKDVLETNSDGLYYDQSETEVYKWLGQKYD